MAPRQRPAPVTAIAYLNLIFGGLWTVGLLCCGGCVLFAIPLFQNEELLTDPKTREQKIVMDVLFGALTTHIPYFVEQLVTRYAYWLIMSVVLVVAGIGLLRLAPWARKMCIIYAILTILFELGMLGYTVAVWNPASNAASEEILEFKTENPDLADKFPAGVDQQTDPVLDTASAAFGTALLLLYPIIVLILMSLPGVKAAFRGEPAAGPLPGEPGVSDDEFFGYERRPEDQGP